jgi:hypothetical protein
VAALDDERPAAISLSKTVATPPTVKRATCSSKPLKLGSLL